MGAKPMVAFLASSEEELSFPTASSSVDLRHEEEREREGRVQRDDSESRKQGNIDVSEWESTGSETFFLHPNLVVNT